MKSLVVEKNKIYRLYSKHTICYIYIVTQDIVLQVMNVVEYGWEVGSPDCTEPSVLTVQLKIKCYLQAGPNIPPDGACR